MPLFTYAKDVHPNHELNSSENNLLYIPEIQTTTYGIKSIKYHCAKLWNEFFKNGSIQVKNNNEKNSHLSLSKIKSKQNFNNKDILSIATRLMTISHISDSTINFLFHLFFICFPWSIFLSFFIFFTYHWFSCFYLPLYPCFSNGIL